MFRVLNAKCAMHLLILTPLIMVMIPRMEADYFTDITKYCETGDGIMQGKCPYTQIYQHT